MPDSKLSALERGLLIVILVVSFALRLAALDAFLTTDEELWHDRSQSFSHALSQHDWRSTYQSGHPGVITMWLGAVAERLDVLQRPLTFAAHLWRPLLRDPAPAPGTGVPPLTLGARRLLALVTWLALLPLYPLLRRLYGARTALVAVALVALNPFFLAHSRLHHLDGLLTAFTTLSVVALLAYLFGGRRPACLVISAVATGLAVASKSPGVLLLPWAGSAFLLPPLLERRAGLARRLLQSAGALAVWGLLSGLVLVVVWPAMWVAPLETLRKVYGVARYYAETPHEFSSYFWFAARADPGPAFYPVVWLFRSTPWALLGLAGLLVAPPRRELRGQVYLLLLWVALFAGVMTVGEKKFDRYLLPVFPVLDVLAALGWLALARRFLRPVLGRRQQWRAPALVAALALAQFALVWPTRPYYISYYNPLLGGAPTAAKVLRVGWGEGLDRAAAFLNSLPNAGDQRVIIWSHQDFVPFFVGDNVGGAEAQPLVEADYYVFYINEIQRGLVPLASEHFLGREEPAYVVNLGGLDYAWLYRNTRYDQAAADLLGRIDVGADVSRDVILFDVDAACARHYAGPLPVRVLAGGPRVDYVRSGLQRLVGGRERVWHVSFTDAPAGISALIDEQLGRCGTRTDEIAGDGLRAVRYDLPPGTRFVPQSPPVRLEARFGEHIRLLGYETSSDELAPGQSLRVTLYWQAVGDIDAAYTVFTHLRDAAGVLQGQLDNPPEGGQRPTADWEPGEVLLDEYEFQVPPDAPPGPYTLTVGLYERATMQRLPAFDREGRPLPDNALVIEGWQVQGTP